MVREPTTLHIQNNRLSYGICARQQQGYQVVNIGRNKQSTTIILLGVWEESCYDLLIFVGILSRLDQARSGIIGRTAVGVKCRRFRELMFWWTLKPMLVSLLVVVVKYTVN